MDDTSPCICGRLRRTARALTRRYDEALAPVGLTVTQFSVMRTLARMNQPTLAALADETAHEKSALWRIVQPLVRKGFVVSSAVAGLRGQRLALTEAGENALETALPHWRAAQADVGRTLGPRSDGLVALLKEIETHV